MRSSVAGAALLCALAASAALSAQQQTTALAVRVVDASKAPVAGARLELVGTRISGLSGDSGWVRLPEVPAGPAHLRVSRIGYETLDATVQLVAGRPYRAIAELSLAPVAVDPVTGRGTRQEPVLAATGFYQRKSRGFGVFLTRDDFERQHAVRTSDVFRRIAGVRLLPTSSRGAHGNVPQTARYSCGMSLFLDGVQLQLRDIDEVDFEKLGAVEVYRGPAEVPPEFARDGADCGVVAMWTRTGDPRPDTASAGRNATATP